jgi:hypothetical protein
MTGPPLPVPRGHAPAGRELSSLDGAHRSDGRGPPQSSGAGVTSTGRDARGPSRRKALQSVQEGRDRLPDGCCQATSARVVGTSGDGVAARIRRRRAVRASGSRGPGDPARAVRSIGSRGSGDGPARRAIGSRVRPSGPRGSGEGPAPFGRSVRPGRGGPRGGPSPASRADPPAQAPRGRTRAAAARWPPRPVCARAS